MANNILICGVGGQGTVLAAKIISQAAINQGQKVLSAETIGMAQRGGSVVSHVRIGDDCYSPLIPLGQADLLISFEAAEAVRNLPYLKKDAAIIVNRKILQPTTASITGVTFSEDAMIEELKKHSSKVSVIDTDKACADLKSSKIVNTLLLGAACHTGVIDMKSVEDAIRLLVKPEFYELNIKALHYSIDNA
ncbi:MAG: indolepyruvate oxidoreductase subunit beta [Treponema sp.]|nr:indolepyruvate oxidoreductase subunit beta [Treponema sp.]